MMALELTGKRFGKITVLKRALNENKKKSTYWLCKCDCGEQIVLEGWRIKDRSQCESCRKGTFYKQIKELANGSIEIIVDTKKYGIKSIFIDKEDLDKTLQFWWYIIEHHRNFYAQAWCRSDKSGKRKGGRLHQLILNFPNKIIDHEDSNGLNNRKCNLRIATGSQNAAHVRLHKDSNTGFKGVSFINEKNLYKVQVRKNNKLVCWKLFKNPLIAAQKYNELALKYHGKFALLNVFTEGQLKELANPQIETRGINRNNSTGYIGVSHRKVGGFNKPYAATIYMNGKNKVLGTFATPELAALAYNDAAKKYKGEKASLNIVK